MQNPLLLESKLRPVPHPVLCRSCLANTVSERGKMCSPCVQMLANRSAIEHDFASRRIFAGLGLAALAALVFYAVSVLAEAVR